MTLATKAWLSLAALAVGMAAILFIPAGTIDYWQAWLYLAVFIGLSAFTTLDLIKRDPALLERRMRGGPTAEREPAQRVIMLLASGCFVALLVVPALHYRFHWSVVPPAVVLVGDALVALGFYGILRVYRENTYTAATIQGGTGQTVIDPGHTA